MQSVNKLTSGLILSRIAFIVCSMQASVSSIPTTEPSSAIPINIVPPLVFAKPITVFFIPSEKQDLYSILSLSKFIEPPSDMIRIFILIIF